MIDTDDPARCDYCGEIHSAPFKLPGVLADLLRGPVTPATPATSAPLDREGNWGSGSMGTETLSTDSVEPFLSRTEIKVLATIAAHALRNGHYALRNRTEISMKEFNALNVLAALSDKLERLAVDMTNGDTSGLFRTPF